MGSQVAESPSTRNFPTRALSDAAPPEHASLTMTFASRSKSHMLTIASCFGCVSALEISTKSVENFWIRRA